MKYAEININDLIPFEVRSIRQSVIERLTERISMGFNPARPLSVVMTNGSYLTADGNHRLNILKSLGIDKVPCVVYDEESDPYKIAVQCNQDEDTYAPMDLFDWLDIISRLRSEDLTQTQIGDRIGWSREAVRNHIFILDNIGTAVLNFAKDHQTGRVPVNGTVVPTNFTEGLFRNILALSGEQQMSLVQKLIKGKDKKGRKYNKTDFKNEAADLKKYNALVENGFAEIESRIYGETLDTAKKAISEEFIKKQYLNESDNGSLGPKAMQLIKTFVDEYEKKQNIKIFTKDITDITGEDIESESIDAIVTDPPYPKEYVGLFENLGELAQRVLKPGGSIVCLVGQSYLPEYINILSKYLDYYWTIGIHMPGGQAVQVWNRNVNAFWKPAIWFTKGERSKDSAWVSDFIQTSTNNNDKRYHHWGQSEQLTKSLVERVTVIGDLVFDPFLGGGTTGVVCNSTGRKFIGCDKDEAVATKAIERIHGGMAYADER